jgi:hypothetical protein
MGIITRERATTPLQNSLAMCCCSMTAMPVQA